MQHPGPVRLAADQLVEDAGEALHPGQKRSPPG